MKNERSKYWTLILYEDSENLKFNDYIEKIKFLSDNYCYILHNKDYNENGEIKKNHYHIVMSFNNYKWLNSLSSELNIPSNYFEKVRNLEHILMYLIHFNDKDKYQYDFTEIIGTKTFKDKLYRSLHCYNKDEESKVSEIITYIIEHPDLSFTNLVKWVVENGFWSEFRRASSIFIKLLDENKQKCYYYNKKGE